MFNTGDSFSLNTAFWALPQNQTDWMRDAIAYALTLMTESTNWVETGSITAEQAASSSSENLASYYLMPDPTGTIFIFTYAVSDLPDGALYCDGGSHATTDFPILFGKIGYTFGGSGSNFNVPDLRGRAPIASGTGSGLTARALGDTGGEEAHLLTVDEIPSHTHGYIPAVGALINGGLEAPAAAALPGAAITSATGGGGSHNNMQPFFVLNFAIVTGQ
jgi:microcystin-dependent protein